MPAEAVDSAEEVLDLLDGPGAITLIKLVGVGTGGISGMSSILSLW